MKFRKHITPVVTLLMMTIASVASLWAANAVAQSTMAQMLAQRFQAADTDHDGRLTREEANAGMPRVAQHFDQIDTSHSGTITLQQIMDFAHRQQGG